MQCRGLFTAQHNPGKHGPQLAGLDASKVPKLRQMMLGGEALSPDLIERTQAVLPDCRIINAYGPTEASVLVSAQEFPCRVSPKLPVSIGRPIPNVKLFILDEYLHPTPLGVAGELCISGFSLARKCKCLPCLACFLGHHGSVPCA